MRKYLILLLAIGLGIFTRTYHYLERFNYAHDNDLASWIIKDIVVDKHTRLIGQLTSSPGIYIGSLWYYLQVPFYLLGGMDPVYAPILSVIVGLISIVSIYYVVGKIYSQKAGEFAAVIYAVSRIISSTEREVVPTTPVFLWSIWLFFALNLILKGNKKGLIITAVLWSLIWHINLALIFSIPLVLGVLIYKYHKYKATDFVKPLLVAVILSLPLIIFEVRHQFGQTKALFSTAGRSVQSSSYFLGKAEDVVRYTVRNANNIFWVKPGNISSAVLPLVILGMLVYLVKKRTIAPSQGLLFLSWWGVYLILFSVNPLPISEYYLNGFSILWVIILAVFLAHITKKYPSIAYIFLIAYVINSIFIVVHAGFDPSGYVQKKALVKFISQDAKNHGYPCFAVSYMTDVGRNLGYRYWFYLNNLHVNSPASGSPVYTIVFPHKRAGSIDMPFGSIGLVYPDYYRYTPEGVKASCQGENSNLTDPMFGFSK